MAQGAAQAIEDGAVLGVVLSKLPEASPEAIRKALKVYEDVRMDRAYRLVELAAASGRSLHLGEGAAKGKTGRYFYDLKEDTCLEAANDEAAQDTLLKKLAEISGVELPQ